jgi:hypothetical protein
MSCADSDNFNGTTSPLKLRQLSNVSKTEKSADGSAFLFFASYHSEERNADYVKVFAEVDGEYRFLEIPMEGVRVKIDSTVKVPYVQIDYTYSDFIKHQYSNTQVCEAINPRNIYALVDIVKYVIICPEQYLPERLLPIDVTK